MFTDGTNDLLDITVDYIHDNPAYESGGVTAGDGSVNSVSTGSIAEAEAKIIAKTSLQWNYENFSTPSSEYGFGGEETFSPETVWNTGTHAPGDLDYNDPNAVAAAYATTNPALSEWIFDVIYEVQIDKSLVNGFGGKDDLSMLVAHVSPKKDGYTFQGIGGEIPGEPIPEPATMLLLVPV